MRETSRAWLSALRRCLAVFVAGSFVWETAQMPLYTLWRTGSTREIALAIVHCAGADVLIGGASIIGSLIFFGGADWPRTRFARVAVTSVIFCLVYTIYSEHLNTARNAWTYSERMPIVPVVGTGVAPLAQWVVVPVLALVAMRWPRRHRDDARVV